MGTFEVPPKLDYKANIDPQYKMGSQDNKDPWRDRIVEAYNRHRDGIARLEGDRNLHLDYQDKLILLPYNAGTSEDPPCPNSAANREPCWLDPPHLGREHFHPCSFLLLVGEVCVEARLIDCRHQDCLLMKQKMEENAPRCSWKSFRESAIRTMSCQLNITPKETLSTVHTHLVNSAFACYRLARMLPKLQESYRWVPPPVKGMPEAGVILVEVCNIIFWMINIQVEMGLSPTKHKGWGPAFSERSAPFAPIVLAATSRCGNLAVMSDRVCFGKWWPLGTFREVWSNAIKTCSKTRRDSLNASP